MKILKMLLCIGFFCSVAQAAEKEEDQELEKAIENGRIFNRY